MKRVGILGPGQMGSAIGAMLKRSGLDVVTALDGRSANSRERAAQAGLRDLGPIAALATGTDVILSTLRPAGAEAATTELAAGLHARSTSSNGSGVLVVVDCNAILPEQALRFAALVSEAGGRFVDAAIQGPPPTEPGLPVYISGAHTAEIEWLRAHGLDWRVLGGEVGQASAFDLVVGGAPKLLSAVAAQLFLAAGQWGLAEVLEERLGPLAGPLNRFAPLMPSRVARWAEEMAETGHFAEGLGLPGGLYQGAADLLERIGQTDAVRADPAGTWPPTWREVIARIAPDIPG